MEASGLRMVGKVKPKPCERGDDEELEMLLGEIPQVTSAPPLPHGHNNHGDGQSNANANTNNGSSAQTVSPPKSETAAGIAPGTPNSGFYVVNSNAIYGGASPLDGKNSPSLLLDQTGSSHLVEDHHSGHGPNFSPSRNAFAELVGNRKEPEHTLLDNQSLAAAFANLHMKEGGNGRDGIDQVTNQISRNDMVANNFSALNAQLNVDNESFSPSSRTMAYGMNQSIALHDDIHSVRVDRVPALAEPNAMKKYLKQPAFRGDAYMNVSEIGMNNTNPSSSLPQYQQPFMVPHLTSHGPVLHGYQIVPNAGDVPSIANGLQQQNYLDRSVSPYVQQLPLGFTEIHQQQTPQRVQLTWPQMEERRLRMQQEYMLLPQAHGHGPSGSQNPIGVDAATTADSSTRIIGQHGLYSSMPNLLHSNASFGNSVLTGSVYSDREWPQQTPSNVIGAHNHLDYPVSRGNLCRYFAQGFCSRGPNCPFFHGTPQRVVNGRTSNPASIPYREPVTAGVSDFEEKPTFPEKLLTRSRSRGVSYITLNPTPPGSRKESVGNNGHCNEKMLSDGHALSGSFHLDIHGQPTGMSPDVPEAEISFRPLPISQQQQAKYTSLDEVQGRIYYVAKDQHGCRFLQRKFDEGSVEDIKKIFAEIIDHIIELMIDPFGNYLVQKLLEVCNEDQRMQILFAVTRKPNELVDISLNMHGTRAVQKLIEILKTPREVSMVISSLRSGVVTLIKDLNGNHVVQRCLQRLSSEENKFLFDAAVDNCIEIATHRHGCCVLQRCIDHSTGSQQQRLVAEIAANALVLSQDSFGNYVVQYILDLDMTWAATNVMNQLEGNYADLSTQKFSSNVVEKCLKIANEEDRAKIVQELITNSNLGRLLQDPYANYVVQCALSVCKGPLHSTLVDAIRPHLPTLRSSPFGKRILSRTNLKK